jgi:hypothetical protein
MVRNSRAENTAFSIASASRFKALRPYLNTLFI